MDERDEGWLEAAAVEYASQRVGLDVTAHLASGGGSTQISRNFRDVQALALGYTGGVKAIRETGSAGVGVWEQQTEAFFREAAVDGGRLSGTVLGMSSACYAAEAAGLPVGQFVPVSEVRTRFQVFIVVSLSCVPWGAVMCRAGPRRSPSGPPNRRPWVYVVR